MRKGQETQLLSSSILAGHLNNKNKTLLRIPMIGKNAGGPLQGKAPEQAHTGRVGGLECGLPRRPLQEKEISLMGRKMLPYRSLEFLPLRYTLFL